MFSVYLIGLNIRFLSLSLNGDQSKAESIAGDQSKTCLLLHGVQTPRESRRTNQRREQRGGPIKGRGNQGEPIKGRQFNGNGVAKHRNHIWKHNPILEKNIK